jgi:hypothetical protein
MCLKQVLSHSLSLTHCLPLAEEERSGRRRPPLKTGARNGRGEGEVGTIAGTETGPVTVHTYSTGRKLFCLERLLRKRLYLSRAEQGPYCQLNTNTTAVTRSQPRVDRALCTIKAFRAQYTCTRYKIDQFGGRGFFFPLSSFPLLPCRLSPDFVPNLVANPQIRSGQTQTILFAFGTRDPDPPA